MPVTYTPIRYPGGKTKLYPLVSNLLAFSVGNEAVYAEAFAGGAGLAMKLLLKGEVREVLINDADRALYCAWDMIVNHSSELCDFIDSVELTISEWEKQREIYRNMEAADDWELGKAAFYLNRTNVSGILKGGVIGGYEQQGKFKIDARFSRDGLKSKINAISEKRDCIRISNLDAEVFINDILKNEQSLFAYFDPPYVKKGPGLYRNHFDEEKHRSLAKCITSCDFHWIATYDAADLIDELYGKYIVGDLAIKYTANTVSDASERLIVSPGITLSDTAQSMLVQDKASRE